MITEQFLHRIEIIIMNIILRVLRNNTFLLILLGLSVIQQIMIAVGSPLDQQPHIIILSILSRVPVWLVVLGIYRLCLRGISGSKVPGIIKNAGIVVSVAIFLCFLYLIAFSWGFFIQSGMFISKDLLLFGLKNFTQLQMHLMQTSMIQIISLTIGVIALSVATGWIMIGKAGRLFRLNIPAVAAGILGVMACVMLNYIDNQGFVGKTDPVYSFLFTYKEHSISSGLSLDQVKEILQPKQEPDYSAYNVKNPVIVIMVESMRSDLTDIDPCPIPFMKRLAEKSIFFTKPYATSSHSDYADLSVWYSQYPLRQRRRTSYKESLQWRGDSIFKVFKELGYSTAYISSQNEKWGEMIYWLDVPEVDYFFDSEDYKGPTWVNKQDESGLQVLISKRIATAGKIEDTATLNIAKQWIESLEATDSFFLGINLQNSHFPYVIPKGGEEPFQPADFDFPTPYMFWPKDKIPYVKNRYLNALYNIDILIRDFAVYLNKKGIWDNCVFVVVGDSGEAFYEHGTGNHGAAMYEEVMKTYTIIKPPKGGPVETISRPVSHIDILPTVLDLLDVPLPATFQGISALSTDQRDTVYIHSNGMARQYGLIRWPWKLLYGVIPQSLELYHLEDDPKENNNLAPSKLHAPLLDTLLDTLDRWITSQLTYYEHKELYEKYSPPSF